MRLSALAPALFLSVLLPLHAQTARGGVVGTWREPGGSVIAVAPCGAELCARLIAISRGAPAAMDAHNPDTALQSRPLCGLTIGTGFHLTDPAHADGGKLYDPKTGKTYKGSMTSDGDTLHLRGYVGVKAFGRTQDWARTPAPAEACR